jgi:SAM-dependent methyltransferase
MSPAQRLTEAWYLYRTQSGNFSDQVTKFLQRTRAIERRIAQRYQRPVEGVDFLEVGPGQRLKYLKYFGAKNRVVGIDLDVIPTSLSPAQLWRMVRVNGVVRTGKTVVRKMLGLDARFDAELARQMNLKQLPQPKVLQMNAERLSFAPESFDVVFTCSTFEHLANPGAVLDQIKRVLRPGGVAYVTLHLYTSMTGCHDARLLAGQREAVPHWAHLRPAHRHKVRPNSYLNEMRIPRWKELFDEKLPGAEIDLVPDQHREIWQKLADVRAQGELGDYADEELLTVEVTAIWQKPLVPVGEPSIVEVGEQPVQ